MMRREQYYFNIQTYKKRREIAKKKFKETADEKYRDIFRGHTSKIKGWKREMRKRDERKKRISEILKQVNQFFNVRVDSRVLNKEHKLARSIYYKVAMESNLRGAWVARFIGRHRRMAELGRKSLTKSFQINPQNREAFHRFKKYING